MSTLARSVCMQSWLAIVLTGFVQIAHAETVLLRFRALVDGTGERLHARELVVAKGRIVALGNGLEVRYPAARVRVLDQLIALPGLIDVHVHMTYGLERQAKGNAWKALFSAPAHVRLQAGKRNARMALENGITSIRDLSALAGEAVQLKALIDAGVVPGPRMFIAGLPIHPLTLSPLEEGMQRDIVAEFRMQAQKRVEQGSDWIKVFATTGSADDLSGKQLYYYPEISAVTDIAHAAGRRVAVHSYTASAVRDALRAGVDSIEHPVDVDDETFRLWADSPTVYVPTIDHNRYYADHRDEYGYDDTVVADLLAFVDRNVEALRRAHAAGVRIAMGSDAVMTGFGRNSRELEWFIRAGMSPRETIQAATVNGARLLGEEHRLGRLQPGFAADIIAVAGEPLADIRHLTRGVKWVMKAGKVVVAVKTQEEKAHSISKSGTSSAHSAGN